MSSFRLDSLLKNKISSFIDNSSALSPFEIEGLSSFSRSFWQKQICKGRILFKKKIVKPGLKISFDHYNLLSFDWKKIKKDYYFYNNLYFVSYPAPLKILKDDENFFALNKPVGLKIHQSKPLDIEKTRPISLVEIINSRFFYNTKNTIFRSGIVHRLDKNTSGVLIVAKNEEYQQFLKNKFAKKEINKSYLALVKGTFPCKNFIISGLIGKKASNPSVQGVSNFKFIDNSQKSFSTGLKEKINFPKTPSKKELIGIINPKSSLSTGEIIGLGKISEIKKIIKNIGPKTERSAYSKILNDWEKLLFLFVGRKVINNENFSLLRIFPKTGRTHQIRVHLSQSGFPIVGDLLYKGVYKDLVPCHFLHAYKINWNDPLNKKEEISADKVLLF